METLLTRHYKRSKTLKDLKRKRVEDLRAALPVLNRSQVRRARLPYWQAIYLDLQDDGFDATLGYLNQLVEYQENLRRQHGKDSAISAQPLLLENKNQLDKVSNCLKVAEIAHRTGKYNVEWEEILKLAVFYYNFPTDDWLWLTEQLLIRCVDLSRNCGKYVNQYEALSRYVFGLFYLNKWHNMSEAKEHLLIVKQLSKDKTWNAQKVFNKKQDRLYNEVCKLISEILIEEGKIIMYEDARAAEKLFSKSAKCAKIVCYKEGETEAHKLEGMCHLLNGNLPEAAITFYRVLKMRTAPTTIENIEKICEAKINLTVAYFETGRSGDAILQLQSSAFAETSNSRFYAAEAHKYIGEYYLTQGDSEIATPLLVKALDIFCEIEDFNRAAQTRIFAAVSAGVELFPKYAKLLMRMCTPGPVDPQLLRMILRWKDGREPFWTDSDVSVKVRDSYEGLEKESIQSSGNLSVHAPRMIEELVQLSNMNLLSHVDSEATIGSVSDLLSATTASIYSVQ